MEAIPIGGDPSDLDLLRHEQLGNFELERGYFHISYVGTIWPAVMPTLRALLRAVSQLRRTDPSTYSKLRLNFIGTTANPDACRQYLVMPLAEAEGVADAVREVPQRLRYSDALRAIASSDAHLVLGSDEPHYTASKIYTVLMTGRPYLSVLHSASSAHAILKGAGSGVTVTFSTSDELRKVELEMTEGLARLIKAPRSFGAPDSSILLSYTAQSVAKRFAAIFERLAA
jgi:hypothetical protein